MVRRALVHQAHFAELNIPFAPSNFAPSTNGEI